MSAPDLRQPAGWYGSLYESPLYPYQLEFATAAEEYIADCRSGLVSEVSPMVFMVSRQGGKNETSARLEARLLCKYANADGSNNLIKSAPTFKPTLITSMRRLEHCLKPLPFLYERFVPKSVTKRWQARAGTRMKPLWRKTQGYIYGVGNASVTFLSGEPGANKVGETASIAIEIDEAQAFSREVYRLELSPMAATRNAPTIFYGTSWIRDNLLEEMRELARERGKRLGRRMLFEFPWEAVAESNTSYRNHVLNVRAELGDDHPIFLSQYCLKPITACGRLLSMQLLELMRGDYPRRFKPAKGEFYVAGVDLSGASEGDNDPLKERVNRDSTVVTIAKLLWRERPGSQPLAVLHVVDHLYLAGVHPLTGVDRLCEYIFEHWGCVMAAVDQAGAGYSVARAMLMRYPGRCIGIKGTAENVDRLGNNLLASINTGRLKIYRSKIGPGAYEGGDGDDSWESDPQQIDMVRELWKQLELCEREYTSTGKMRFEAPEKRIEGKPIHDDFVKSLSYAVEAAQSHLLGRTMETSSETPAWQWGAGYD